MPTPQLDRSTGSFARVPWAWLIGFVSVAIVVRLAAAILIPTIARPDEIFQNLEPAHRIWADTGIVSWEWRTGIRSWLFPAFLSGLMSITTLLHLAPDTATPLIWAVLAVVASGVVAAGVLIGWHRFGATGAIMCGILTAFWPDLVYFGPKTLGEVQAGNLLVIAAALAALGPTKRNTGRLLLIGFLLGIAFDLRFQLALSLFLVACWAGRTDFRRSWLLLTIGAVIPLVALGVTDWMTFGSPFQSVWKNVQVNLFQHKAESFGVQPIHKYVSFIVGRNGAAALAMLALFVYGFNQARLLALTAISVVAFHSLIAHKEVSFVYAALPCAMIVTGLGAARFIESLQRSLRNPPSSNLATGIAACIALATIVAVDIAEKPFTQAPLTASLADFFRTVRTEPDLCGLGLVSGDQSLWSYTGGYASLNRPVPIYMTTSPKAIAESRAGFNYAITAKSDMPFMTGFTSLYCSDDLCLMHRPTDCQHTIAHEISAELIATDQ